MLYTQQHMMLFANNFMLTNSDLLLCFKARLHTRPKKVSLLQKDTREAFTSVENYFSHIRI